MESFVEELKHQVLCSLCNETMVEPKLLQCFHTFCKSCIKKHAQLDDQVNIFKCPQCTSQTLLQELDEVEDLQLSPVHSRILQVLSFVENQKVCSVSASHSKASRKCLDCGHSLCDECHSSHSFFIKNHKVVSLSDMKQEDLEVMLKRESPCKTHADQEVEWYCEECGMLICMLCLKEHHHDKHKLLSLQEFIANGRDVLYKNLEQIEKVSANEEKRKQQEEIALDIQCYGQKAKEQVKKLTKELVKALIEHEQKLLKEIQKSITKADRNLRIICHIPAAQEYFKYFMQNGTASEMIEIQDAECSKKFTYEPFEKDVGGVVFKPNKELCQQVSSSLGLVQLFKKADPKISAVNVESDIQAMKKAKLTVVLKTSDEKVADESLDDVVIQITPEDDVKVEEKQKTVDGEVTVDFTARVPVELTAEVQVRGNPVSNSPLVMDVKPQQIVLKETLLKNALNTGSCYFGGIAVNKTNSRIAVADYSSHCFRVFNMEGDLLLTFGSQGSEKRQLNNPLGLAFLNETNLVIADNCNHRVCIVNTAMGKLVKTFGCQGNRDGEFCSPCAVYVDDNSNIIVCDTDNHRVQVFTKDGDYLYQFGVPNGNPYSAITHNGLFYVSDYNNSVVHVIEIKDNQTPTTVTTIGGTDCTSNGRLQNPRGLAIDNDNNLLVCSYDSMSVNKFTLEGHYVGKINSQSYCPYFIAVLKNGDAICSLARGAGVFFF